MKKGRNCFGASRKLLLWMWLRARPADDVITGAVESLPPRDLSHQTIERKKKGKKKME
jgi:hypothetical protein